MESDVVDIGFEGTGSEVELKVVHETERGVLLQPVAGEEQFWMPKAAFTEDGLLLKRYERMLQEKLDDAEQAKMPFAKKAQGEARCRSCGATVVWKETAKSRAPFNLDGTSHFATCPQGPQWRKKQ